MEEGSFFAFFGPNGAGKSTSISILCSLLGKDSGEVEILGNDLSDPASRTNIGVVFQESIMDPRLTVRENITLRGAMYGLKGDELKSKVNRAMEKTDALSFSDSKYGSLSGGQRRRADIARALVHEPRILFLDEPTSGLDPQSRQSIWETIADLNKESGTTVFLTTHYMEEATVADDIVIIDKGEIVAEGTPDELRIRYCNDTLRIIPKDVDAVCTILTSNNIEYYKQKDSISVKLGSTLDSIEILQLLKDEMELPERIETTDTDETIRRVSMEEAVSFLDFRNLSSARVSLGVMLCILSPVLLILLSGAQELGLLSMTEQAAVGIGTTVLLILVVIAVALFVTTGLLGSRFSYLEEEAIDTEYGVTGMVRERRENYRHTFYTQLTIGIVLCVAAAIPILSVSIFTTNGMAELIATCVMLVVVAIGVLMIVRSCIIWGGMQILLEEGDYTREEKSQNKKNAPIATIYWCTALAIYLAYSFITRRWDISWIVWPVAGVFYGVVAAIMKLLRSRA